MVDLLKGDILLPNYLFNKMKTTSIFKNGMIFLCIFSCLAFCPYAWGSDEDSEKKQSNTYQMPPEIEGLCVQFEDAIHVQNDLNAFDSLASLAILKAEGSFNHDVILQTKLRILESIEYGDYKELDFKEMVIKVEDLTLKKDNSSNFNTWLTITKAASRMFNPEIANKFALKCFSEATLGKSIADKVEAYLAMGKSLRLNGQYLESYQNYLHAKTQVEMVEPQKYRTELKKSCYNHLFWFFDELRDFDEATDYKYKHILLIMEEEPVDSMELMWAKLDMIKISIRAKKFKELTTKFDELLGYAERVHHKKLHDYTMSIYRTFLIETNDSEGFYKLYFEKYPEELADMKWDDPVSYFRINAHIAEYQQDFKLAQSYYQEAMNHQMNSDNYIYKSNLFRRYGQFLLKNEKNEEALAAFQLSFDEASKYPYLDFMVEASYYIDSLSLKSGDIDVAYQYSKIHNELLKKQSERAEDDEFMLMNLRNEQKRMELLQEQEAIKQKKQHDLQYLLITALICFLMIIFVVASQMKVPLWVVKGSGFVGILMIFEFIILILDYEIHHLTHGAPFWIFVIKVMILFVLFPLHHLVEKAVIKYMLEKKMVLKPQKGSLKNILHTIWPWMKEH